MNWRTNKKEKGHSSGHKPSVYKPDAWINCDQPPRNKLQVSKGSDIWRRDVPTSQKTHFYMFRQNRQSWSLKFKTVWVAHSSGHFWYVGFVCKSLLPFVWLHIKMNYRPFFKYFMPAESFGLKMCFHPSFKCVAGRKQRSGGFFSYPAHILLMFQHLKYKICLIFKDYRLTET